MKLEKWALIAEVVGSIAIVVTLIILIAEVRVATNQSKLDAYEDVTRDFDEWRRDVLGDERNVAVFLSYPAVIPEAGTEEAVRHRMLQATQWSAHERAYYARLSGIIDDERWGRVREANCREYLRIPASDVDTVLLRVTDEFRSFLVDNCE